MAEIEGFIFSQLFGYRCWSRRPKGTGQTDKEGWMCAAGKTNIFTSVMRAAGKRVMPSLFPAPTEHSCGDSMIWYDMIFRFRVEAHPGSWLVAVPPLTTKCWLQNRENNY